MIMIKPDPRDVKNFLLDNPLAKIVCERGKFYACELKQYWDSVARKSAEERIYRGRIVDGVHHSMANYRRLFKRDDTLRAIKRPKNRPYHRKSQTNKTAVADTSNASESVTPAASVLEGVSEAKTQTKNDEYPLEAKRIGGMALVEQTGLREDFGKTWGETACSIACSLACHWLSTAHNATYLFESWSTNYPLAIPRSIDGMEISVVFKSIASCEGWEKSFVDALLTRISEDEIYSYDSEDIATKSCEISGGQDGETEDGGYLRQIGLSILFGQRSSLPIMFRLFPGNIADVSTVVDLLSRVDMIDEGRLVAAVQDHGNFSFENIERCNDGNYKVLIAVKNGESWLREAIECVMLHMRDSRCRLCGCPVWGKTVEKELDFAEGRKHPVWVHVFRDNQKSHLANVGFLAELIQFEDDWKSSTALQQQNRQALLNNTLPNYYKTPAGEPGRYTLERDLDKLNEAPRYFGFFASVSTMQRNAQRAIETYHHRDDIENCFKAGRSDCNMDSIRSQTQTTMTGRFIVSSFALTVLSELRRRMRESMFEIRSNGEAVRYKPLCDELSLQKLMNDLNSIKVVYCRTAEYVRLAEVTERQCLLAKRLRCEGVYDSVPEYAKRN